MDNVVNNDNKAQSKLKLSLPTSPKKPNNDLIAIIINDVATAFFIGKFAKRTSAGIIKNPPPAPTIPVNTPTTKPSIVRIKLLFFFSFLETFSLYPLIIKYEAINIINAKNNITAVSFERKNI